MEHTSHAGSRDSFSLIVLMLLTLVLTAYGLAAARQRSRGRSWNFWRTASFSLGVVLLGTAVMPPLMEFAYADLRGHMVQHLLLGMFVSLPLALGAPGTLLLRTLPARAARRVVVFLSTRPVRVLIHPVTALVLNIGGMYLLYLTPLYLWSAHDPAGHFLVHLHFFLAGYIYIWSIAGPDPAPYRPGLPLRLIVLFVGTGAHAILSKLMYAYGFPRGGGHELAEIQAAAQLMYYGGDLAEMLLIVAFFSLWFRRQGHQSMQWSSAHVLTRSRQRKDTHLG